MIGHRPSPLGGTFDDHFWTFASSGEYRLQKCGSCSAYRYPPAACCPTCLSEAASWDVVPGRGTIVSWTRFHRQYFDDMPPPYVVVSVALSAGPMVIGNLLNPGAHEPVIGAEVRLELVPAQTRDGQIKIPQWVLSGGPDREQNEKELHDDHINE